MTKSEDELIEIEIFKTAFESSYDGIHILDHDGRTLYINKACERIEGLSEKEAKASNIRDLVASGVYSESVTLKVLDKKEPVTIIQKVKNGNEILATGTPIYKDEMIDKIVVNSRDITELNNLKRKLQEKEELAQRYHKELELLRLEQTVPTGIIAKSSKMEKILKLAKVAAKVDSTILISGESGVGKGVLSKFIHDCSQRSTKAFIKIDCSAIPETLFESELFGYEKGAFTGADKEGKMGLMELANGGTMFLDEIGEVPLSMQSKLLRAIQDREFLRVGGKQLIPIDVRIIAATNRNLEEMVAQKQFREDLYYRLNVIPIVIPPLRERSEDIHPLILEMVKRVNKRYGLNKKIGKDTLEWMIRYQWPGNIRELENIIERMVVTAEQDLIVPSELPSNIIKQTNINDELRPQDIHFEENITYRQKLEEFDRQLILEAIEKAGSIVKAADLLQVNVTTVRRKLERYELSKVTESPD